MVDEMFQTPYVDVDEQRPRPVPHRYVHGGFEGTETRFSIYLPPPDRYAGRFFQHLTPVPDSEHLAQHRTTGADDKIGFAISSGGYFLETNGGTDTPFGGSVDASVTAYRANAATARYSRVVAAEMYGPHRPYGYAFGGSGGAYRTLGSMENTDDVWDGFVPYVMGSPVAIPNVFTVRLQALRVLRDKFPLIVDAVDAGGGDMYAGLDDEERAVLEEATRMGFPPGSWFAHETMGQHAFAVLFGGIRAVDPSYFTEFWTEPGYLGSDPPAHLDRDRVRDRTTVVALATPDEAAEAGLTIGPVAGEARGGVDTGFKAIDGAGEDERRAALRLADVPQVNLDGVLLTVRSGEAEGESVLIRTSRGALIQLPPESNELLDRLAAGDEVELDNSDILAVETYHRHQDPGPLYRVWDQFRDEDGEPRYPQRPTLLGPMFTKAAAGSVPTGLVKGKVILVEALWDSEAYPWQADWYRARVQEHHGDAGDDRFRLWFVDRALHGDTQEQRDPTRTVSYVGVLHQALRDLAAWVEDGVEPPVSTAYEVVDGQVVVPTSAADRRGVQPVVSLTANGGVRADVAPGETVRLRATVEAPPGAGLVVSIEWDLDGTGEFATRSDIVPAARLEVTIEHQIAEAGTHFPTVRVASHREGDADTPFARLENLARARVVVADPSGSSSRKSQPNP